MTLTDGQYEERVVVFIDILGFRELIRKTVQDASHYANIKNALNMISSTKEENDHGILAEKEIGKEVTVFSDSIVVSYPVSLLGSVFYLLLDIVHLQLEMLRFGILMRGGMTVGKLYHNDNIVYGPAMIEAYELESKVAVYPRVLVSKMALETATKFPLNPPEDELKYVIDLLHEDFDSQLYVNFMSQWQEVDDSVDYLKALLNIKNVIEGALKEYEAKPSILVKYEWLKKYYTSVVEGLKPEYTKGLHIK